MAPDTRKPTFIHDFTLGIAPLLFGLNLLTSIGFMPIAIRGGADFRQIYTAAWMVRNGHAFELYSYDAQKRFQDQVVGPRPTPLPFVRPAFNTLFFVPLTWFSYRVAYWIFMGVNIGLLALCFFLLQPWMQNLSAHSRWHPITVFASFTPVASALTMGQDSIMLLTLLTLALVMLHRQRDCVAGVLVGLGSFKFYLTIPILVLFTLWKKWRFTAGFCVAAVTVAAVSVGLTGAAQTKIYLHSIFSMRSGLLGSSGQFYTLPVHLMPNLHGLVHGLSGGTSRHVTAVTATLSLIVLLWVCISTYSATLGHKMMTAITAAVVVSYYVHLSDLALLLAPLVFIVDYCARTNAGPYRRVTTAASVILLVAPTCYWFTFATTRIYLVSLPVFFLLFVLVITGKSTETVSQVRIPAQ